MTKSLACALSLSVLSLAAPLHAATVYVPVLEPLSAVHVEPDVVRQPFNDTDADQLWLVVGAPKEAANTLEMTEDDLAWIYPDGPKAKPPELGG